MARPDVEDPTIERAMMRIEAEADAWLAETPDIGKMVRMMAHGWAPHLRDKAEAQIDALVRQTFVESFYRGFNAHKDHAAAVEAAKPRFTGTGRSEAEDDDSFSRELQAAYARNDAHGYACVLSGRLRQMDKRAKAANIRADQLDAKLRLMRVRAEAAEAERSAIRAIPAQAAGGGDA